MVPSPTAIGGADARSRAAVLPGEGSGTKCGGLAEERMGCGIAVRAKAIRLVRDGASDSPEARARDLDGGGSASVAGQIGGNDADLYARHAETGIGRAKSVGRLKAEGGMRRWDGRWEIQA